MNPEQQRFLVASYGCGWQTADLLLSDEAIPAAKAATRGGMRHGHQPFWTTGRGIERGWWDEREPVIPWRAFAMHRATLPAAALDRLREARQTWAVGQRGFPAYRLPADILARRVGPSQDIHPDDRQAAAEHHTAYLRDVLEPWRAQQQHLRDALTAAILACLPDSGDEPADLLDHLAAMEVGT